MVNQSVHFYIDVVGTKITISNDSGVLLTYDDSTSASILPGKIAFFTSDNDGGVFYDNLVVTEYEATNIRHSGALRFTAATEIFSGWGYGKRRTDSLETYTQPKSIENRLEQRGRSSLNNHDAPSELVV